MTRIAIEAGNALKWHPAGVARYTIELLGALARGCPEFDVEAWYPWRRLARRHQRVPDIPERWYLSAVGKNRPRLLHATGCVYPPWKSRVEIATVHDLFSLNTADPEKRERSVDYIRRSDWVICISDHTRDHLHRAIDYPRDRSVTIPLAVDRAFRPAGRRAIARLRRRYELHGEFLLYVGKGRTNKNLERLVEAHARSGLAMPLCIAGSLPREIAASLDRVIRRHGSEHRVIRPGYVRRRDLPALMSAATAFCFPSTFEGFGLPVLEAMACGTAVLTSRGVATEEVAAGLATLVDPYCVESIAAGLHQVIRTDRSWLAHAARHAQSRDWSRVAAETAEVYTRALAGAG